MVSLCTNKIFLANQPSFDNKIFGSTIIVSLLRRGTFKTFSITSIRRSQFWHSIWYLVGLGLRTWIWTRVFQKTKIVEFVAKQSREWEKSNESNAALAEMSQNLRYIWQITFCLFYISQLVSRKNNVVKTKIPLT